MNIVVYVYNSFNDPLFRGNLMMYIDRSATYNYSKCRFYIITYEQKEYKITDQHKAKIKKDLANKGIIWLPLQWHTGGVFKLFFKFYDLLKGLLLVGYLRVFKSARWMITLGSVSGSFGFLLTRIFAMKLYAYQFEPHSEFLLDMSLVKKTDFSYRVLSRIEKLTEKYADIISTGTDAMLHRLTKAGTKAQLFKIPSAVNENRFTYSEALRNEYRKKLKVEDKKVFVYAGKIGGVYFYEELFALFKFIHEQIPESFFLILTPQSQELFVDLFKKYQLNTNDYKILKASHEEVGSYLCASDLGIVAVPPTPAQKFRSPIKVGEYLLSGLPYITCKGVSEDDVISEIYNVGVVLNDFKTSEFNRCLPKIVYFLNLPKQEIAQRCRQTGLEYRGFNKYYLTFEEVIKKMLQQ